MDKIKIQVLDPTGITVKEMEMDWSADQLERFISGNRIVVEGKDEIVSYICNRENLYWEKKNGEIIRHEN